MRFKRHQRFPFEDTPRKRAALAVKQRREREAIPLFASDVAAGQRDADTVMRERAERWERAQIEGRARRAQLWRDARKKLAAYPIEQRRDLLAYWQRCGWPADPVYLSSMLHMYDTNRLDPNAPAGRAHG